MPLTFSFKLPYMAHRTLKGNFAFIMHEKKCFIFNSNFFENSGVIHPFQQFSTETLHLKGLKIILKLLIYLQIKLLIKFYTG